MNNPPSFWEIASSISTIIQTLIAGFVAWYGYKKYLEEETIEPSDERIQIFSTSKQTTELRVTDKGLECHIYDIRQGRGGHQWTQTQVPLNQVKVTQPAESKKAGRITIGSRHGWLYSHKLWPEPQKLETAIKKLINRLNA